LIVSLTAGSEQRALQSKLATDANWQYQQIFVTDQDIIHVFQNKLPLLRILIYLLKNKSSHLKYSVTRQPHLGSCFLLPLP